MALPCALFSSSCDNFTPDEFVKQILKVTELPAPDVTSAETKSYEWDIDTKYYRTKIHLCTTEKRTIGDKEFAESVEAFIHYFDPNVPSSFELATAWLPYLDHIEPQVLMLVCKSTTDSHAVGRKSTLQWCVENGFELVELEPEPESDDEDNDFPETKGMARIIQALHAHTWPNLELKDSPPVQSPLLRQMMKEQHLLNKELEMQNNPELRNITNSSTSDAESCAEFSSESNKESPHITKNSQNSSVSETVNAESSSASESSQGTLPVDDIDWGALIGAVSGDGENDEAPLDENDRGVEEFEQLFMKLKVMKDKAETLPPSERKKYAEQVAISFWNAIGGDKDEIGNLDTDSD